MNRALRSSVCCLAVVCLVLPVFPVHADAPMPAVQPATTLDQVLARAAQAVAPLADPSRLLTCDEQFEQAGFRAEEGRGQRSPDGVAGVDFMLRYRAYELPQGSRRWTSRLTIVGTPATAPDGLPWTELHQDNGAKRYDKYARAATLPRLATVFLHDANRLRFDFRKTGEKRVRGIQAWKVDFREQAVPTVLLTELGMGVKTTGSFLIDPESGHVLTSVLQFLDAFAAVELTVNYGPDAPTGLWLPTDMREEAYNEPERMRTDSKVKFVNWRVGARGNQ